MTPRPVTAAVLETPAGLAAVIWPASARAWLPAMRRSLRDAQALGARVGPEVRDVLAAVERVAAAFVPESRGAEEPQVAASSGRHMRVPEAADHLGISEQAVRLAARDGRLQGQQVDGIWIFERMDVERWEQQRRHHRRSA